MSVGPTRGPVQRPGIDRDLTEIFQRVEDLERVPPPDCCTSGATTYPDAILAHPDVWAYWPFDDVSGNPRDLIAGRDLTLRGGPIGYGAGGPFPNLPAATAVTLDGVSDWMSYDLTAPEQAQFFSIGSSLPWTWVGWFYLSGTNPDSLVTLHNNAAGASAVGQDVYTFTANKLGMNRYVTNVLSGVVMPPTAWRMVAATYAGSGTGIMKLYFSGAQIATLTETSAAAIIEIKVGAQGNFGIESNFWNGRMSQLAMFTAELSAADLLALNDLQTSSGSAPAGYVWTADGSGGATWELPTIEVDY